MFKIKNKKGLSLIEVMMVVAIIGIMTAISIVSFVNSRRNAVLSGEADVIIAAIREAQNYALTGKNINVGNPAHNCHLYRVIFDPNSYVVRNGDTSACSSNGGIKKEYPKKNGVTVSPGGNPWFQFEAPHATVSSSIALVGQWRAIILTKSGQSLYVCLNSAGVVKKSSSSSCI